MNNLNKIETKLENAIHPFWVFRNELDDKTCKKIINLGKNKWSTASIGTDANINYKDRIDLKIRKTDIAWSDDEWLYKICWGYLHEANRNSNWNFEVSASEMMQITKYKKDGHYNFHYDSNGFTKFERPNNKFINGKTRKLSMSIVLNDDYEGGEFEFFDNPNLIKEKKGTIIVFPSYLVHRVKPVTKGTRYSLVVWFCGEPFK